MTYCRLIAPEWLTAGKAVKKVVEGLFSDDQIKHYNDLGYNVYFLPNFPSEYTSGTVNGSQIDTFSQVFIDYDCKSNKYAGKDAFIETILTAGIEPSSIIDSGNGVHVYYTVNDLDVKSYLRLSRRLMRLFNTDEAVGQIFQLMRLPNTKNTKDPVTQPECYVIHSSTKSYTCEELDQLLPPITAADEQYCVQHYDKTYNLDRDNVQVDDVLPPKFGKLLAENHEAKSIWANGSDDRSKSDFRLAHIMMASKFTKAEAMSVLVNSAKAMARAPIHRVSYAENIVDKIWTFETTENVTTELSESVEAILQRGPETAAGKPFRCHKRIDNTQRGFRLGDVIGLVAGSGVGKTAFALNAFKWFIEQNPDYHHFFIPLEQPAQEIADRWAVMCGSDTSLNDKVHVISNYNKDGSFRHLSFDEIKEYLLDWQDRTGLKAGCVVIDHIGALKKKGAKDENQDLMTICHNMKAFAVQTNTLLIMQSQTSRQKAGWGDLELDKDAAYGTATFEWYCDYLITMWQPLKRCHMEPACPTVTAFKYCKIRHKKPRRDMIQEDVPYYFYFDSETELMKDMTQDQITSFNYFLPKATNKRKAAINKTEILEYTSTTAPSNGDTFGTEIDDNRQQRRH